MKSYHREISSGFADEYPEPIIFLHGMFQSGECFGNVAPTISKNTKRKVYLLDARNHGESPWTADMDYDLLVEDVLEFVEEHNIKKSILVGSSMGARTALYFALKYPHRVEALVVEDMTPQNLDTRGENNAKMILNLLDRMMKTMSPDMDIKEVRKSIADRISNILGPQHVNKDTSQKAGLLNLFPVMKDGDCYRMKCNLAAIESMLAKNAMMQNLPRRSLVYDGDALFIYGSKPFFNLGKDPTIQKLFPKAVVKQVKHSSHFIYLDSVEEYIRIVSNITLNRSLLP